MYLGNARGRPLEYTLQRKDSYVVEYTLQGRNSLVEHTLWGWNSLTEYTLQGKDSATVRNLMEGTHRLSANFRKGSAWVGLLTSKGKDP